MRRRRARIRIYTRVLQQPCGWHEAFGWEDRILPCLHLPVLTSEGRLLLELFLFASIRIPLLDLCFGFTTLRHFLILRLSNLFISLEPVVCIVASRYLNDEQEHMLLEHMI